MMLPCALSPLQTGHDFRPAYTQLAKLREHFAGVPCIALVHTLFCQARHWGFAHAAAEASGCHK